MTLLSDRGWRLWVSKGHSSNYYYISHPECSSEPTISPSCGMVAVGAVIRQKTPACYRCSASPPSEMMGMIKLIEWDR
jgi:hypothetical protein